MIKLLKFSVPCQVALRNELIGHILEICKKEGLQVQEEVLETDNIWSQYLL